MARGDVQSCAACELDGAARLEPCLLKSLVVETVAPNSNFAIVERNPSEPEENSCNHSDVSRVRGGKFGIGTEFDACQEGHGQTLGLKRPVSSES